MRTKHPCSFCGKKFPSPSHLDKHLLVHTKERPFKCDLCDKRFAREDHFSLHQGTHSGRKPFQCSVCKKAFSHKGHLRRHEAIHSASKPYKCTNCSKSFSQRGTLKQHENLHLGVKPFKCDICKKCFSFRGNLATHMEVHNNLEENVKCEDCREDVYPGWVPPSRCESDSYSLLLYGDEFQNIADLHDNMKAHFGTLADKCSDCRALFLAESRTQDDYALNQDGQMTECLFCGEHLPQGDLECHMGMHTRE